MPSAKPRITVILDQPQFEIVEALAKLQHRTKAAVCSELLSDIVPLMRDTVAVMQAAAEAPIETRKNLVATLEAVERDMHGRFQSASNEFRQVIEEARPPEPKLVGWDALTPEKRERAIKDGFTPETYDAALPNATRRWARETPV